MSMHKLLVSIAAGLAFTGTALAEMPPVPKPGPEHEKLGYFVGKWNSEGSMKETPFGPGGKITNHDDCQWFQGKFAVICNSTGSNPAGPTRSIGIISYSTEQSAYTFYGADTSGTTQYTVPLGTIDGDTWTYKDTSKMGGQMVTSRYVIKILSPDSYAFHWDVQDADGTWNTVMEGKEMRVKAAAKPAKVKK